MVLAQKKNRLYAKRKYNSRPSAVKREMAVQCIANACVNRIDLQNNFMEVGIPKASMFFLDFINICKKYDFTKKDIKFLLQFAMGFTEELKAIL